MSHSLNEYINTICIFYIQTKPMFLLQLFLFKPISNKLAISKYSYISYFVLNVSILDFFGDCKFLS